MAEYYPLLAKAVGSLPNSTPDTRRIVYERARKALIGQLRTLHPPIPDEEIENESVALDRAIEKLEGEIANGSAPAAPPPAPPKAPDVPRPSAPPEPPKPTDTAAAEAPKPGGPKPDAPKPDVPKPPGAPLFSSRVPAPRPPLRPPSVRPPTAKPPAGEPPAKASMPPTDEPRPSPPAVPVPVAPLAPPPIAAAPTSAPAAPPKALPPVDDAKRLKPPRPDRPIAPQPPTADGPKRRLWILPVAVGLVVAGVAIAAWKLRDHPNTIAQKKPAETSQADSSKIAERVGGPKPSSPEPQSEEKQQPDQQAPQPDKQEPAEAQPTTPANPPQQAQGQPTQAVPPANNPELPVAHRAALLVQAPDEPNKIKTFLGRVVWKLNNAPQGPNDSVGVAVEADIDLPDDKMKVVVTFAKNTEASLPASHTINIKFMVESGSYTGDVKQINVPQMRPEDNPGGEPLAGVTVQIVPNSFLVGLSPGNAETANTELIRKLQWIDIPMLLDNGKLAKLTFEKGDSGQRDLNEAFDAWQKQ